MAEPVSLTINGRPVTVPAGTILAAALLGAGEVACRSSVTGEPRGPVCGMGICFECRVTVNGRAHQRSCMLVCEPGMDVRTEESVQPSAHEQPQTDRDRSPDR